MKPPSDLAHKGTAVEEWLDLRFFRPVGIRIARALAPTGTSADQVTAWSLAIGLVAGHLFAYPGRRAAVLGFALFIMSDVLDSADGQLARLRGTSSRLGRTLDGINDSVRFLNLYCHLIYRLIRAGWWWPGAVVLVACAGLAHTYQSAAVDFVRNAFLRLGIGSGGELDLPEDLSTDTGGSVLERFAARVYRDYVLRQSQFFAWSIRLVRLLRRSGSTEAFRAEYRARQGSLLPLCGWLGQNIRFLLLGVAALLGQTPAFLWVEAVPLSLLLLVLIVLHERNASSLAAALGVEHRAYARIA